MASVNKVILVGNLGKDPETRYAPSGDQITNITVATTDKWKDKATGEQRDATEWHRVVFFGKLAEIAGQYLKKGSQVYIEGRLKTRKWQGQDGQDRYTTEINADSLQMLGKKEGSDDPGRDNRQPKPAQPKAPETNPHEYGGGALGDFIDDIPFAPIGRGAACNVI